MKKIHSLIVTILIIIVIFGNYLYFSFHNEKREYVFIEKVKDGDTVLLEDGRTIRLLNINTPEKGRPFSNNSSHYLSSFMNKTIILEKSGTGKYGRVLGRLYYNKKYLNLELIKLGFAHTYYLDKNEKPLFIESENNARINEIGIWEKSKNYGCLMAEIHKKEEYVVIINSCGKNLAGWMIKDESSQAFILPNVNYPTQFIINSSKGENTNDEIFWGRGNVWNDDKDSIFIRDKNGKLVYYNRYGY